MCQDGIKHAHCALCNAVTLDIRESGRTADRGTVRAAERLLCQRWLAWAEEWGDADMRQALVADTRAVLGPDAGPVRS
jgi:hypothetical protein